MCVDRNGTNGFALPRAQSIVRPNKTLLTTPGSTFAASMLRDIERGSPIEGDHIIGDLVRHAGKARSE